MKKYISLLSLTALMVSNNAYTMGKPLTAQEKIRVNTLLVRQKNLNMDIDRLKSQNKNVPATKTKDLTSVTNAINTYELRDPQAVAQIRKGFTTAAKTPTQSTAKPKKPSSQPVSSGTLQPVKKTPAVSGSPLGAQSPVVQINPLYDNIPNKPRPLPTPPVHQPTNMQPVQPSLPIKEKESAIGELKLLDKKNQLDSAVLTLEEIKIQNLPTQKEKKEAIDEVFRNLQKEFDQNNSLDFGAKTTITNTVKSRLNRLLITDKKPAQEAKKPNPLYPVINQPEAPKWLDGNKLNEATLNYHIAQIKSLPSDSEKENEFNKVMGEVYEEFLKSPLNQEEYSGGLNDIYDKIRNDLQSLFSRKRSPLSDDLGESVSIHPSKKQQPKSKKPAVAPVEQNIQVMQWTNLKQFLATNKEPLYIGNLITQVIKPTWLTEAFNAINKDLVAERSITNTDNKIIQKAMDRSQDTTFKDSIEREIVTALFNTVKEDINKNTHETNKNKWDNRALIQITDAVSNNLYNKTRFSRTANLTKIRQNLLQAAATEIPLFTDSIPNMDIILAKAKATNATLFEDAMAQMKKTLIGTDRATWDANEERITTFLEHNWDN